MKLKQFFSFMAGLFKSDKVSKDLKLAADFTVAAIPYIDIAAQIITGLTPTTLDDAALLLIHTRYPQLFDGSLKTQESRKLFALGVASDLLKNKFPQLSTTIARTAVQVAYLGQAA